MVSKLGNNYRTLGGLRIGWTFSHLPQCRGYIVQHRQVRCRGIIRVWCVQIANELQDPEKPQRCPLRRHSTALQARHADLVSEKPILSVLTVA